MAYFLDIDWRKNESFQSISRLSGLQFPKEIDFKLSLSSAISIRENIVPEALKCKCSLAKALG